MQSELMKFDPATGEPRPYPSHAEQWRKWHGHGCAWLFNPWTGERRDARDVGSDTAGRLIDAPGNLGSDLGLVFPKITGDLLAVVEKAAAPVAPAAVASPLTKLQRKAIAVFFTSDKVSVSEVQRKLSISYADAQTLCQSIVDLGLTDELELAPSLKRGAPAPQPAPVAQAGAVPLTHDEALDAFCHTPGIHQFVQAFVAGVRFAEHHHGIKGGQHGTE